MQTSLNQMEIKFSSPFLNNMTFTKKFYSDPTFHQKSLYPLFTEVSGPMVRTQNLTIQKDCSSTPLLSQDVSFNSTQDPNPTGHKDNGATVM